LKKHKKVQVWIAAKQKSEWKVLIFRVIKKRDGGWHPVTGSVDDDEPLLDAAKRETFEETGLAAPDSSWCNLLHSYIFEGRWGKAEEFSYGVILPEFPGKITLDPREHEVCEWVSITEAEQRVGFGNQKEALELFAVHLQ
jgi:8-oxo-dGTP pyrophosphatase MutT (NUDIX family)